MSDAGGAPVESADAQAAVSAALDRRGDGARILVVPHGNRVTARGDGHGG